MSTTTVSNILTDVRYDIRDIGAQRYDDTYLIKMLNRGLRVLEQELVSIGSGLLVHSTTGTLSTDANTLAVNNTHHSILRVYISQTELYFLPMEEMYRRQIDVIGSSKGQPNYYSTWGKPTSSAGRNIVFDYTADQDYTVSYIYNKLTGDLDSDDYMPYDDAFNDYLREGIAILCEKTKDDTMIPVDRIWRELFRNHMYQFNLAAGRTPIYYKSDF